MRHHGSSRTFFAIALLLALTPLAQALACRPQSFGAKADGTTKDTAAIQAAIDDCASHGGGVVRLTAGTYLSAPLALKSHVNLALDQGAILFGSPDFADYPLRPDAPWRRISLLHADKATDISITGSGIIDGNGQVWWTAHYQRKKGQPEEARPLLIDLTHSQKILIEGVTLRNSPMYNIMAVLCDGLTVRNVHILNPGRRAPNTDGIDPVSTSHVLIEHDTIDTGDDNVAIKSGLVERGDPDVPSRDIIIRDCNFLNGHGLSIGSETAGGVQNVTVERVSFRGTRQGIRLKSARGRGNDLGPFTYRDITMEDVETPIQISDYYTGRVANDTGQPVTSHTPRFHDITIENVKAIGAKTAITVDGLPESPIRNLVMKNVHISAAHGMIVRNAQITEQDVVITAADGAPLERGPGVTINGK
ncbi:MAG: glycoside hydrolase family 28 protein [Acidobacteriaceae bacterium]